MLVAYFSKQKFIESMKRNPLITDEEEIQESLQKWVDYADGKTVEELKEEGLMISSRWVEYMED